MNNITNDRLMPVTDVYSETSLWRGCSCLLCNTLDLSNYSDSKLSETPSIYESAPDPFYPDNNITGNPYLDSLIWGGSWDLSTNYGGPAGTITYSFVPYYVSDHEFYDWYDWEKEYVSSALSKIENVTNIDFVEKDFFAPSDPYGVNLALVPYWEDSTTLGFHEVPEHVLSGATITDYTLTGFYNWHPNVWNDVNLAPGGLSYATVIHEVLHSLGLYHTPMITVVVLNISWSIWTIR